MQRFVLTLSCPDRMGIVAAVANFLMEHRCNIVDSAQFNDADNRLFFMRVSFTSDTTLAHATVVREFASVAPRFSMQWQLYDMAVKSRVCILVSKFGHCLNDLLYRYRIGALHIEIPTIVSNHPDFYQLAASLNIPFHHLPIDGANKSRQEARLLEIIADERIDLVVLARYMQVLSPNLCQRLRERAINIHHSFLPSFQGAKPYEQAHLRGVKLIGATAHYVTEDLDEGPIIEQDVTRADHSMTIEDCAAAGRDVECAVLARAVKWHTEHRILLNGARTVVFR
ncbi:MAG: formyltetrahydrofolate deformylase [Candidatus Obscuribacterales bacterium]|nr:formyltetrahydrofolate deformylase [Steroidobacteraceae bacterium]